MPWSLGPDTVIAGGLANTLKAIMLFALGYGGQFIIVVPNLNLVVTATNNWNVLTDTIANNDLFETLSLIMNNIIPAFN